MRKKLFLILLSFSLVFLFLTISNVHGEGWNNAETWSFNLQTPIEYVTITLGTNPSGLNVRLDGGTWYASPKSYVIVNGTSHSIECQSPQSGGTGKQYVWTSWSDTGANPHNVSPTVNTTYTATYKTQWFFAVTSAHDAPTGEGWYDSGTSGVHSTVTSPSEGYITMGWTGTGSLASGGTRGSTDTGTFTITQYTTCVWNWALITWHNAETWTFNLNSVGMDTTPPTYSNIGHSTTTAGYPCKFSCKWTDETGLGGYIFSTNNTGSWVNDTFTSLTGKVAWANKTKTLSSSVGMVVGYRWYCVDTSSNWNDTGIQTLTITATPSVTVTIVKPANTTYTSSTVPVEITATGGTIHKIWFNCKNGSNWIYPSNITYTVPTSMTGFVNGTSYKFYAWANNTDGNKDEKTVMFTVAIPPGPGWHNVETWTFDLNSGGNWHNVEVWTLNLNSAGIWRDVEVWTFSLNSTVTAVWNNVENWTFTLIGISEIGWHNVETWSFKISSTGCFYIVHGPYYEDGTNATALVTVVLTQPHDSSFSFDLDGTDGNAKTVNITVSQPATYLAWNISTSQNYTRIYYFLNTVFDEVWIFIPKPSEPCYPYEFGITDFYGMKNPYLETVINVNGQSRIVERKKLNVPTVTFFMIQWHRYDLRFRCDQGVYTQEFSAETTWLTNIPILSGAFPTTPYDYPTVMVTRTSGSVVTIAYADPTESTVWIYFQIYHYVGQIGVEDWVLNTTGNSYLYPWSEADNMTNYYVYSRAYADSKLWEWRVPALTSSIGVNPWTGIIVPSLGTFPLINVDVNQVIAGVIILCVLGIFSYASAGVGCILSLIVAGIFVVMGWFVMSLPMFMFGAFVAVFVMIEEAKRTEREV